MAKIQENEYAYVTLNSVREAIMGRLQSIEIPVVSNGLNLYPNGVLVGKGDLLVGEDHVFGAIADAGTDLPWVLAMPEINTAQNTSLDNRLGIFRNKTGKALVGAKLSVDDVLTYSRSFFATEPTLGAEFALELMGEKFTVAKGQEPFVLKVIGIKDSFLPTFIDGNGQLAPVGNKEYKVMVVAKEVTPAPTTPPSAE